MAGIVIAGLRWIATAARLAAVGLLWVGGTLSAQEPRTNHRLSLRLMDLSFAADSISGLLVEMRPSARSKQSQEALVSLRFHPDTVLEWINHAAVALRILAPNAPADGIQWSRALLPRDGKGAIAVGRERRKGKLQKEHWLAVADSTTGWRAEMDGADADSLLNLLLLAGSQSRVDTTDATAFLTFSPGRGSVRGRANE